MNTSEIKLGYRERDKLFKKEYSHLKIKVALNWLEVILLSAISIFTSLKLHEFISWEVQLHPLIISILTGIGVAVIFCYFRKNQLKITRFDKEHIYKKISDELINQSKDHGE